MTRAVPISSLSSFASGSSWAQTSRIRGPQFSLRHFSFSTGCSRWSLDPEVSGTISVQTSQEWVGCVGDGLHTRTLGESIGESSGRRPRQESGVKWPWKP